MNEKSNYEIEEEKVVSYVTETKNSYTIHGQVIIKFKGKQHEISFSENYNKS